MAGLVLTFLRPRRFLAPWHRTELERADAGLPPLIEPPPEGRTMTMTRRERVVAWVLVAGMVVAWWVLRLSPVVLIGVGSLIGLIAVIEVRGR
jgi:hypothetical protein